MSIPSIGSFGFPYLKLFRRLEMQSLRETRQCSVIAGVSNKYYTSIFTVNLEVSFKMSCVQVQVCRAKYRAFKCGSAIKNIAHPSAGVPLKISRVINCTIFLRIQRESMDPVDLGDPRGRERLGESSDAGRITPRISNLFIYQLCIMHKKLKYYF